MGYVEVKSVEQFREYLGRKYTFVGCYPTYFVTADGGVLSHEAAVESQEEIEWAIANPGADRQWEVRYYAVNYEAPTLYCDHTGERIESAYAEEDEE